MEPPEGMVVMIAPAARVNGEDAALGTIPALDANGAAIRAEFAA